jgi:dTDP-4-dehydrorhamnose reductase
VTLRVFVVGSSGQVARSLREADRGDGAIALGFGGRPYVDLTRPATIAPAMRAFKPDIVVNAAGYTAVDTAELEPELAHAINGDGAHAVAMAADGLGVPIIHLSTDYVFDGRIRRAYVETDAAAPLSVYGQSKLAGEQAVARSNAKHIILRTSWVYAPFGSNFVRTMVRLSNERQRLHVVDDQFGHPTYAPDIAAAVLKLASRLATSGWRDEYAGVTHLAGPTALSWCAFARAIVAASAARGGKNPPIEAIATADYATAAKRPPNSRLATERLRTVFGLRLPPLHVSLGACLDRLLGPVG